MTMATLASTNASPTGKSRESRQARSERIFQSLPALGTKDYLDFLKAARRDEPPAGVLVRAYRQLHPSDAADATLGRLADSSDPPGYLILVVAQARRRRSRLGAYTPDDLVANTVGEIVGTIAGPKGRIAEGAWALYLETCLEEAYRALVGRGGFRIGSPAEDETIDPAPSPEAAGAIGWRARVEPSHLEWLEAFIERTMNEIADDDIRAIGLDLFSEHPTPVSSSDPKDQNTLTGRFGVSRHTIYRWQDAARWRLYDALDRQGERDIDLSFLKFGT